MGGVTISTAGNQAQFALGLLKLALFLISLLHQAEASHCTTLCIEISATRK
jgi:hypothetical protein